MNRRIAVITTTLFASIADGCLIYRVASMIWNHWLPAISRFSATTSFCMDFVQLVLTVVQPSAAVTLLLAWLLLDDALGVVQLTGVALEAVQKLTN